MVGCCALALLAAPTAKGASILVADTDWTGSRSTAAGDGLVANGNQASGGFVLTWTITLDDVLNVYHYKYEFERESGSDVEMSHFNIEVSPTFEASDMLNPTGVVTSPGLLAVGSGNKGMPADMSYAVKFDSELDTYEFDSPKVPVWSDFFGKKGNGGVYNIGFGTDPLGSPFTNWVAAPDSVSGGITTVSTVPLPGAVWMGLALLGGLGVVRRIGRVRPG